VLNEKQLRRDDFVDGVPVVLTDGQTWTLARPIVFEKPSRFRRKIVTGPDGAKDLGVPVALDGDPYFGKLAELVTTEGIDHLNCLLDLGARLLARNYNIEEDAIAELLALEHDANGQQAEENREMWATIADTALGISPPPSPVG
jgi:hypothetical protein